MDPYQALGNLRIAAKTAHLSEEEHEILKQSYAELKGVLDAVKAAAEKQSADEKQAAVETEPKTIRKKTATARPLPL